MAKLGDRNPVGQSAGLTRKSNIIEREGGLLGDWLSPSRVVGGCYYTTIEGFVAWFVSTDPLASVAAVARPWEPEIEVELPRPFEWEDPPFFSWRDCYEVEDARCGGRFGRRPYCHRTR